MDKDIIFKIKNTPYIYNYLREDSSWYKKLIRNPNSINELEKVAKKYYKLDIENKISELSSKIEFINNIIDIIK